MPTNGKHFDLDDFPALTDVEHAMFQDAISNIQNGAPTLLMRALFDGQPVAVIVGEVASNESTIALVPVAILLDRALMDRLVPPPGP